MELLNKKISVGRLGRHWIKPLVGVALAAGSLVAGDVIAGDASRTVIALFGDSTTTGFNANFGDRYGNGTTTRGCPTILLTNLLLRAPQIEPPESCPTTIYDSPIFDANTQKRNVIVANWGIGGSTTESGISRISSNLAQTKTDHVGKAYITLIIYGTNDFNSGISTSTTRFNLRQMIQSARALGYTPVLGTLTPRDDRDISPYNSAVNGAASDEGVAVVDHFTRFVNQSGGWRSILQQEVSTTTGKLVRFHPTDEGYMIIAETWFDQYLRSAIKPELSLITPILPLLLED
ncbi:hypothetical protein GCM10008090_18140 [Arenicella chitinivorans]|uniref:SGNH hydrolase-type esterase domain-containing protein n=1 Tax=Arenicella chitinivorans TaxID=1329800 RepID=A0A918RSM0_9GAMM|nr:SGNH/GDSL hydrolase family protein [Arenicella chitinivorans]GHA08648.1 hypothetical protein GCM10008090_18140 [Arenicella chitinivorans]